MNTWPRVGIIVLNWNGVDDTLACLESLARLDYPTFEVIVVDNGSADGSVLAIRERFSGVTLIENGENLGYTGGNNVGLRRVLAQRLDYALLLNNDTEVPPDSLRLLVEVADAYPAVGIVGPTIYYYDQPQVIWSAGGAIDWRRGQTWMVGLNEHDIGQFGQEPREVDFVTGCALLVKREVLERVGLLDERFFAYYEETEWCVRIKRAGFRILHVPSACVWHKIRPEAQKDSPLVHYYMTRNRLLFLKVAGAGAQAWLHTLLTEYLCILATWTLKPQWWNKWKPRNAMLWAIGDALCGRWGKQRVF